MESELGKLFYTEIMWKSEKSKKFVRKRATWTRVPLCLNETMRRTTKTSLDSFLNSKTITFYFRKRQHHMPSVPKFRICDKLFVQTQLLRH